MVLQSTVSVAAMLLIFLQQLQKKGPLVTQLAAAGAAAAALQM